MLISIDHMMAQLRVNFFKTSYLDPGHVLPISMLT